MARYCPLFSGSDGNSTYIGNADAGILIDAGVSAKRLETALTERGIDPRRLAAIFVTHEHGDHVRGIRVFANRYGLPVYATAGTLEGMECERRVDVHTLCREMAPGSSVTAGGCLVRSFPTPHDSRQSCGYRITTPDGREVAIATDMGHMSSAVRAAITGCDLVHIESNHDVEMLRHGAYPDFLKQRILAATGHLANVSCAAELPALAQHGASRFVLAHLSKENNRPALAYETARQALAAGGLLEQVDYLLRVATPEDTRGVMVF